MDSRKKVREKPQLTFNLLQYGSVWWAEKESFIHNVMGIRWAVTSDVDIVSVRLFTQIIVLCFKSN